MKAVPFEVECSSCGRKAEGFEAGPGDDWIALPAGWFFRQPLNGGADLFACSLECVEALNRGAVQ